MECTRWRKNRQAYLEVIWKENKTDDVICLHFGVYGNTCGHMIPSSVYTGPKQKSNMELKAPELSCKPMLPSDYFRCVYLLIIADIPLHTPVVLYKSRVQGVY